MTLLRSVPVFHLKQFRVYNKLSSPKILETAYYLLRDEAVEDFSGLVWWGGLGGGEAGQTGRTDGEAAETFVAG